VRKNQVKIGETYAAKVSERIVPVTLVAENRFGGWIGRNEKTKRDVRIKSAARLRFRVAQDNVTGVWRKV
jgi:hypothetical protein